MTWDFGGQEEYYATHQCFISRRSLYLVVWNATHGTVGAKELRPWLLNIQVQWNLSVAATLGERHYGCYTGVAFVEVFFKSMYKFNPDQSCYNIIAVGCCSGVAVKRDSTAAILLNSLLTGRY